MSYTNRGSGPEIGSVSDPQLGDRGLTIIRQTDMADLSLPIRIFEKVTKDLTHYTRGERGEKDAALQQLSPQECQNNALLLGGLGCQETIDTIYGNVPSLRKKLTDVVVSNTIILGRIHSSWYTIAINFEYPAAELLQEERANILQTLEEAGRNPAAVGREYKWHERRIPAIAIGRVSRALSKSDVLAIRNKVDAARPETISLQNAQLIRAGLNSNKSEHQQFLRNLPSTKRRQRTAKPGRQNRRRR